MLRHNFVPLADVETLRNNKIMHRRNSNEAAISAHLRQGGVKKSVRRARLAHYIPGETMLCLLYLSHALNGSRSS